MKARRRQHQHRFQGCRRRPGVTSTGMSDIEAAFDRLAGATPATIGIAIVDETGLLSFGKWTSGVAWSTIKVPLAIAALRADTETESLVVKAIVDSDNQASEALWSKLGPAA